MGLNAKSQMTSVCHLTPKLKKQKGQFHKFCDVITLLHFPFHASRSTVCLCSALEKKAGNARGRRDVGTETLVRRLSFFLTLAIRSQQAAAPPFLGAFLRRLGCSSKVSQDNRSWIMRMPYTSPSPPSSITARPCHWDLKLLHGGLLCGAKILCVLKRMADIVEREYEGHVLV